MLVAKEANVHLVVLPLKDFGRPVAKSFHLGPHQVVAGGLPGEHTHKKKPNRPKIRPRSGFLTTTKTSQIKLRLSRHTGGICTYAGITEPVVWPGVRQVETVLTQQQFIQLEEKRNMKTERGAKFSVQLLN